MARPNLFLIGAAKAGTSSVTRFLESNPDVFVSPIKEPTFFCTDVNKHFSAEFEKQRRINLQEYLSKSDRQSVHQYVVESLVDYERLFEGSESSKIIVESSTYYLPSKDAPAKIKKYNPNARIIAVLRSPVDRIRSHYLMDWRTGIERRSLEVCLREEVELGVQAHFGNCRMYLAQSDYEACLRRYRDNFDKDAILVLSYDELFKNESCSINKILEFLDLPERKMSSFPRVNETGMAPRHQYLDRILYNSGLKRFLATTMPRMLPLPMKNAIKNIYFGRIKVEHILQNDSWKHQKELKDLQEKYMQCLSEWPS